MTFTIVAKTRDTFDTVVSKSNADERSVGPSIRWYSSSVANIWPSALRCLPELFLQDLDVVEIAV